MRHVHLAMAVLGSVFLNAGLMASGLAETKDAEQAGSVEAFFTDYDQKSEKARLKAEREQLRSDVARLKDEIGGMEWEISEESNPNRAAVEYTVHIKSTHPSVFEEVDDADTTERGVEFVERVVRRDNLLPALREKLQRAQEDLAEKVADLEKAEIGYKAAKKAKKAAHRAAKEPKAKK